MQKDIKKIADHFTMKNQRSKTVEELGELIQVISKMQTEEFEVEHYINLIEEIADVEIMLEQMKYLHEIDESDIDFVKKEKIQRTIERHRIE